MHIIYKLTNKSKNTFPNKYMCEGIKQMYEMLDNDSKTAAFSRNRDRINEELSEESWDTNSNRRIYLKVYSGAEHREWSSKETIISPRVLITLLLG